MIVVSSRGNGGCRRRPSAFHNLRSASASAISVRTPYLVNRQSDVYEREGIDLDVSTLADWVDAAAATLMPLVDVIRDHVFAAERVRADDTTVPVLAKGKAASADYGPMCAMMPVISTAMVAPGSAESECAAARKFAHYRPGISLSWSAILSASDTGSIVRTGSRSGVP
jgi:hypothetical protein